MVDTKLLAIHLFQVGETSQSMKRSDQAFWYTQPEESKQLTVCYRLRVMFYVNLLRYSDGTAQRRQNQMIKQSNLQKFAKVPKPIR